jgi:hypothetical protein
MSSYNYENENCKCTLKNNLNLEESPTTYTQYNFGRTSNLINTKSSQMDQEAFSGTNSITEEGKMRLSLMEKDKIIFEYSKTLKETERVLENSKKLNSAKEEVISKLKDELRDLKFQVKNNENLLRHKEEEFEKYKNHVDEKIIFNNKDKSHLEEKLAELTKLFEQNQSDFQSTLIEYKKIEKQLIRLKSSFNEKNETIINLEKFIENLKKDNKYIPGLKKQIQDMEVFINEIKLELKSESMKNNKICQEKEEIERKFKNFIEENKTEKDQQNKNLKLTYELEQVRKDYEEKVKEISIIQEKQKSIIKENDNFVFIITNEISQFSSMIDNIGNLKTITGKGIKSVQLQQINSSSMNANKLNISNNLFSLKYELINKNFEILRNKIIDNFNNSVSIISKLEKKNEDSEKLYKEISTERDSVNKEFSILKSKCTEETEIKEDLQIQNTKINEDYKNLKQNFIKLKNEYDELTKKNEAISTELQIFLNNVSSKLKDKFPDFMCSNHSHVHNKNAHSNSHTQINDTNCSFEINLNINFAEKILYYLDILINEYDKLVLVEKENLETNKMIQIQLKNSEDEKEIFKARIERILLNKEDELKKADGLKNEELKRQREVLYEKISSVRIL